MNNLPDYIISKIYISIPRKKIYWAGGKMLRPTSNHYKYIPQIEAKNNLLGMYERNPKLTEKIDTVTLVSRILNDYVYYGQFENSKFFKMEIYNGYANIVNIW